MGGEGYFLLTRLERIHFNMLNVNRSNHAPPPCQTTKHAGKNAPLLETQPPLLRMPVETYFCEINFLSIESSSQMS